MWLCEGLVHKFARSCRIPKSARGRRFALGADLWSKISGRMKRYYSNCPATKCRAGMRSSRPNSVGRRRTGCSSSGNEGFCRSYIPKKCPHRHIKSPISLNYNNKPTANELCTIRNRIPSARVQTCASVSKNKSGTAVRTTNLRRIPALIISRKIRRNLRINNKIPQNQHRK